MFQQKTFRRRCVSVSLSHKLHKMSSGRRMIKVVNFVRMDDEDSLDVLFWQKKSATERLQEVTRLRKSYYSWLNGSFPEKIEKIVNKKRI